MITKELLYVFGVVVFIVFMIYCALGFLDNGFKLKSRLTNDLDVRLMRGMVTDDKSKKPNKTRMHK